MRSVAATTTGSPHPHYDSDVTGDGNGGPPGRPSTVASFSSSLSSSHYRREMDMTLRVATIHSSVWIRKNERVDDTKLDLRQ